MIMKHFKQESSIITLLMRREIQKRFNMMNCMSGVITCHYDLDFTINSSKGKDRVHLFIIHEATKQELLLLILSLESCLVAMT